MNFKNFLQSSKAKHILAGIGIAVIALLIFQAGMFVGYKKAAFSFRSGDNFYRTFGERGRGFPEPIQRMGLDMMDPTNAHGTIGKIASIVLPKIMIADRDGVEKTVIVGAKTDIRRFRDSIKPEELKVGDFITVIGEPNDEGQIEARLIRVMPTPPNKI
ncbi:MAG: hypothetical protein WC878_04285 [Candidatus Paceibacterota bacterium]|jgi:hypothetical protein